MQISEEEKSLEGIPFSEAIKRPDKKPAEILLGSEFTLMTRVQWDDDLEVEYQTYYIESLGKNYDLAIEPDLPKGYEMKPHPTWEKLNSDFIEAIKNEPEPSKKHQLFLEMEKFVDLLGEERFPSLVNLVEENEMCFDEAYRNWFDENFGEDI